MWCLECFQSPHSSHCSKALKPHIAFYCDKCGDPVLESELEDANCYESPDGKMLCSACVDTMSVRDALEFLGCFKRLYVA